MKLARMEFIESNSHLMLASGSILCRAGASIDGIPIFLGSVAALFGACGGTFRRWRDEPGLWMFSGLFLVLSNLSLVFLAYGLTMEVIGGRLLSLSGFDILAATGLLALQVQFLATITGVNWILSHEHNDLKQ